MSRVDLRRLGPALTTLGLALAMRALGSAGLAFAPLFFVIAGFVAAALRDRGAIFAQLSLAAVGLVASTAAARPAEAVLGVGAMALLAWLITRARERWEERHDELRSLARRDPVTGVANFRALGERLNYEITRHRRHKRSFAVLTLDLNRFKEVNERYGHLEGDRLLEAVAAAISTAARAEDTVARQGGDEFCLLAPETDREGARILADRVAEAIAGAPGVKRRVTASVGWAVFPDDGATARDLLMRSDLALMHRKELSRGPGEVPRVAIARSA